MSNVKDLMDRMMGIADKHRLLQILRSWCFVSFEERNARLRLVIILSVELERIRAVNVFSTRLGEGVIEYVIEGDWKAAWQLAEHFKFEQEREELRAQYAPLWRRFVELVEVEQLLAKKRDAEPIGTESWPD